MLFCGFQSAVAQMQQLPPIPVDQNVRIGVLDNGLTYYIRHNEKPEHQVEFYIAQKVGSILEEPQQRGLAHFLEHMAFNGTKNFPGDETGLGIVEWCESKGIKFGYNLNAYTSVDRTVYNISNVPSTDPNVVDSCLLILHDWSSAILLADKEIDKERGVIREEWRSRNSGILRLYTDALPTLYEGTKYTDCMPIGSIDIINNFPYQDLRDYYAKWYRPDLQGIVIVGDIDVDKMEADIKRVFADIPKPVNAAERVYYPVTDNKEPLIYIGKDKEISTPMVSVYFKHDATPDSEKGNMAYYLQQYVVYMASSMLNTRFMELQQSANPPFVGAGGGYGDYFLSQTKSAFTVTAQAKPNGIVEAMQCLLTEVERARRYGFLASEYERARANYLQSLESAYMEREKTRNEKYVNECVEHFLVNEPMPGIEFEYTAMTQIAPTIPVEAINQIMQELVTDENQAVFIAAPDKEGEVIPTKEEVAAMLKGMKQLDVQPYVDQVSDEPLMKEAPKGGKIVSEKTDAIYGTTELVLSNGVKVYVKHTDFKADEIRMKGTSLGGTSVFPNEDKLQFTLMNGVMNEGGIGDFSNVELTKMLAGKKVSLSTAVGSTTENVNGSCSPKDLETLLQLTYLSFTAPRKDEQAFESYKSRMKAQLESAEANPMSSVSDTIGKMMYGDHPRYLSLKADMIDQLDYDRIIEMYKDRFGDASDFTFYFVGNIDLATAKPLIEAYLGSLPAAGRKESFKNNHMDIAKGILSKTYAKEQQTPMATVIMLYTGKCKYSLKDNLLMSFLTQALNMVYTEEIREKEGGTYGVQSMGQLDKYPREEAALQIFYQTDPSKVEHLNSVIDREMKKMAKEGPSEEQMSKIKEFMQKQHKDNLKENSYWMNCLDEYFYTGVDNTAGYEALIDGLTAKDVQKFVNSLIKQGNKITVVMTVPQENK